MNIQTGHRWSDWPGAWCLDCGIEDPFEIALAECRWNIVIENGEETIKFDDDIVCTSCPCPGAKTFDPYSRKLEEDDI